MLAKNNLVPLPGGANPLQYVAAVDWNPLQLGNTFNINSTEFGSVQPYNAAGFPPAAFDVAPAITAAFTAAQAVVNGGNGAIYFPQGVWWTSQPVWNKFGQKMLFGDDKFASLIRAGAGDPVNNPTQVQGFAGPMYTCGTAITAITYGSDLFGASGRSLNLVAATPTLVYLHDAYSWMGALNGTSSMALEFRTKITSTPNSNCVLVGSRGSLRSDVGTTVGFGVYITGGPGSPVWNFLITTSTGGLLNAVGPAVTYGATYDVSMNYNGSFLDCYINGVNVVHAAKTGTISQQWYEGVTIGEGGTEGAENWSTVTGQIQSIHLCSAAQHTGVGSYTPSGVPFTLSTNTLALINFDQGDPPDVTAPWILGKALQAPGFGGYVPHFMRLPASGAAFTTIADLGFFGNGNTSGIVNSGSPQLTLNRVSTQNQNYYGYFNLNNNAFYCVISDSYFSANVLPLKSYMYNANNIFCNGGICPAWVTVGPYNGLNILVGSTTQYGMVANNGFIGQFFSSLILNNCSIDAEGTFPAFLTPILVAGTSITSNTCNFQANAIGANLPAAIIDGLTTGGWISQADLFTTNASSTGTIEKTSTAVISDSIQLFNPVKTPTTPWTSTSVPIHIKDPFLFTDSSGTPGNATQSTPNGRFAMAAAATTVTITNILCNSTSNPAVIVQITPESVDATATRFGVTYSATGFTVTANAAATGNVIMRYTIP